MPEIKLKNPVTTAGWYETTEGKWAFAYVRDGLAHVDSNVRARPPTSAEELEETRAEFAAQDAAREAAWRK